MISRTLLSIVRCPDCRSELRDFVCTGCGRQYPPARATAGKYTSPPDYLDMRPREQFAEQTKYLDEALHVDAQARAGLAAAARVEDPQRHAARIPGAARR